MTSPQFILPAAQMFHAQSIADFGHHSRYNLQGVHIEPIPGGGAFAVATDGRLMLIQRLRNAIATRAATITFRAPQLPPEYDDEEDDINNPICWHDSLIRIEIIQPKKCISVPCHWARDPEAIRMHLLAVEADGPYPYWRKVIGAATPETFATPIRPKGRMISPELLAHLAGAKRGVKLHHVGHNAASTLVTFEDDPDSLGILMFREADKPAVDPLRDMLTAVGRTDLLTNPQE